MDFERIHVLVKIHSIDNIIDLAFRRTIVWQDIYVKEKSASNMCIACPV